MAFQPIKIVVANTGPAAECRYRVGTFKARNAKKPGGKTLYILLRDDLAAKAGFKKGDPASFFAGSKEDAGRILITNQPGEGDNPRRWGKKGQSLQIVLPYAPPISASFPERDKVTPLKIADLGKGRLVLIIPQAKP